MFPKFPIDGVNNGGTARVEYEFGSYRLNPSENLVLRNEEKLHLTPKALELLVFLVERNNRVVSKAEIIEGVWSDSFVEESNLAVHVSALRKVFSGDEGQVSIETLPRLGYRLKIESEVTKIPVPDTERRTEESSNEEVLQIPAEPGYSTGLRNSRLMFSIGLIFGIVVAAAGFYWLQGHLVGATANRPKVHSFKTVQCSRDAASSSLEAGGCEEAVAAFSGTANPNRNWSYGYTPKDDILNFNLFTRAQHNKHFGSPEVPVDTWSREDEWHPMILRNNSHLTIVIQEGLVVPPNMFEMHPGPNGEHSTLRWTAPAAGHFRAQGQFRGLNTNTLPGCRTSTDALVLHNSEVRFSDNVEGYNIEKPFDLTFKVSRGDTIDFSVGFGTDWNYECDSTGFSVMITTIAVSDG